MKKLFIIPIFLFFADILLAQNNMTVSLLTITAHPFAETNKLIFNKKIDNSGTFTFEPGLVLNYENKFSKKAYFKISAGIYVDRFGTLSGLAQIALKYKLVKYYKHSFSLIFGPTFHYASLRDQIPEYINEEGFKTTDNFNYKVSWLSGGAEYNYFLSKKTEFSVGIIHSAPKSFGLTFGIRFSLPDPNGKGCDCPSYK